MKRKSEVPVLSLAILIFFGKLQISISTEFLDFEEFDLAPTTPLLDVLYSDSASTIDCQCGKRNKGVDLYYPAFDPSIIVKNPIDSATTFIIGGKDAARSEFPWLAAITKFEHRTASRWKVVCGATLVNSKFVVTAAHCMHKRIKETLEVVLNARDTSNIRNDPQVIRVKIKQIIPHPDYKYSTYENDIALVELLKPVDLIFHQATVRPVCLPNNNDEFSSTQYNSRHGTVAGWGYTSYPGQNSANLLKIDLPILSNKDCLLTRINATGKLTDNMLCAGMREGGKDACVNDSGGPLVVQQGDRNVLVGLVSWGIGCAQPNAPGVYTRVGKYVSWIHEAANKGEWCNTL